MSPAPSATLPRVNDDPKQKATSAQWMMVRALGGIAVLVTVGISLLRFVDFDAPLLYGAVPVAPFFAAIATVATAATFGRRATVAALAAVLVAAGLALPGRVLPRTGCELDYEALTIMAHNVYWRTGDPAETAAQILTVRPDVVLLQESHDEFLLELLPLVEQHYPYVVRSAARHTTSMATLSRLPLSDVVDTWVETEEHNPFLITTVDTAGGPVRIANVHMSAPIGPGLQLRQALEYEVMSGSDLGDVDVFMGDFNSSASHADYRRLVASGFTDAHREVGCGSGLTWSMFGVRLLSLDHMLTAPTVQVTSFEVLDYGGSDHKAIAGSVVRVDD